MEKIYINTLRIAKKKVIRYALQKKKKLTMPQAAIRRWWGSNGAKICTR